MRSTMIATLFVGLGVQAGVLALADDANSDRPVRSHKQLMRDCVAKEKSANTAASDYDVKKICEDKIKSYDNHPSETTLPPANPGE